MVRVTSATASGRSRASSSALRTPTSAWWKRWQACSR